MPAPKVLDIHLSLDGWKGRCTEPTGLTIIIIPIPIYIISLIHYNYYVMQD